MDDRDERYSWGELLACIRAFWSVRERGAGDGMAQVRMLDVSRAYERLSFDDKTAIFLGIWLEEREIPAAVVQRMKTYLNEGDPSV